MRNLLCVVLLFVAVVSTNAQTREYKIEDDGFEWYKVGHNGKFGAQDRNGNLLIPTEYDNVWYSCKGLVVSINNSQFKGLYSKQGRCILPISRNYTSIIRQDTGYGTYYLACKSSNGFVLCDVYGQEKFRYSKHIDFTPYGVYYSEYCGTLFVVKNKENKLWGGIDEGGNIVVPANLPTITNAFNHLKLYALNTADKMICAREDVPDHPNYLENNVKENSDGSIPSKNTSTSTTNRQTSQQQTQQQTQQRQLVPIQVWIPCSVCNNSGVCQVCRGNGYTGFGSTSSRCISCSGMRRCSYCAGQGGHYETRYQ